MLDNQGTASNAFNQQIVEGTPVYDINGEKVGDVSEHGVEQGALVVHKGLFFPKDIYVPTSYLQGSDANGVYLSLAKDELKGDRWQSPPAPTEATTGMRSTGGINTGVVQDVNLRGTDRTARTRDVQMDTANTNDVAVPVREEELVANKQREQIGEVRVHRNVTEEQQNITAPVTHEEVYVERVAGRGNEPVSADAFSEKDIEVPVMGEELNVTKEAHVAEEVRLRKERVTEQQTASDTVRREHVDIDGEPPNLIQRGKNLTERERDDSIERNTR